VTGIVDRAALADFLRRSRGRVDPASVGLPPRGRRRTPGLRREDVAQLAGISVDYYARLEQQRGAHPSEQVIKALARALRLTEDECDYLHRIAGYQTIARESAAAHVRPGILLILDRLVDAPAQVVSDSGQILARNVLAAALFGAPALPGRAGNATWNLFTDPAARTTVLPEDLPGVLAGNVANLRAVYAQRPQDGEVKDLIRDLLEASAEFRELWERHDVAVRRSASKTLLHPEVGRLELDCEVLLAPSGEQRLVLFTARPGTDTAEKLKLLRVLGSQPFAGDPASPNVR
jgi:transcriptional regulator with XRE-family HTH domain